MNSTTAIPLIAAPIAARTRRVVNDDDNAWPSAVVFTVPPELLAIMVDATVSANAIEPAMATAMPTTKMTMDNIVLRA